jgi:chromosome partitioning protein
MISIAFHLQKGGVGKTTLSGTLAVNGSYKGRTLLIDCDPQGNASSWFLKQFEYELADTLMGKVTVPDAIVKNVLPNFDILPTFGLDGGLKLYGETKLNDEPFVFCDLFDELMKIGYDYVVADLSPGMGRLEKAVLIACDQVITPMTPEFFSLDGITIFDNELAKLKKAMRRAPKHTMIILNAFDARIKQHCAIVETAKKLPCTVFTIPVDPVFRKSQAANVSSQNFGGMKPVTEEIIRKMGNLLWR